MPCKWLRIQCKYYVNSFWCMANSSFVFWNSIFFFSNDFDLELIKATDAEPADMEGQLYFPLLKF